MYYFLDAHWVDFGMTLWDVDVIFTQINMNNNEQMNVKIIVILINTHQIIHNKMLPDERA